MSLFRDHRTTADLGDRREHFVDPLREWFFEFQIAIDTLSQLARAESFEARFPILTRLAEKVVAGVTQCEHGEVRILHPWGVVRGDLVPEANRIVRHLAITIGAGDNEQALETR